jgi:signal transduction histidine kinase
MKRVRDRVAATRAHTDASLGAERSDTDEAAEAARLLAQRLLDDLIERDRVLVDDGLVQFREKADTLLAGHRAASLQRGKGLAAERRAADQDKKAERAVTDALLETERHRSDRAVGLQRREHDAEHSRVEVRRDQTDDSLSMERGGADLTVTALSETKVALADAQQVESRRREQFGMVAHDLRSPLCIIVMNSQFIHESTADAPIREAAEEVTRAAVRMERLLADLLDVARIEAAGGIKIVKRPHDVGAFVIQVFNSYHPLFAERNLSFTVEVPKRPLVATFDHDRLVQVLSNLLSNAMKFTRPEGVVVLHVEALDQWVEFKLQDNGPGISPEVLPRLFEPFQQSDNNSRRGLGLGLYICKEIVEAHGGRIWVDGNPGGGTIVRFTLPRS